MLMFSDSRFACVYETSEKLVQQAAVDSAQRDDYNG